MSLPPRLINFINKNIQSIDQIETLLILYRNPTREWSPTGVMAELRTSVQGATNSLEHLAKRDLCVRRANQMYIFSTRTSETASMVADLDKAYAERRVSVINIIYTPGRDPLQAFSDSFRLRDKGGE